MTYAVERNLTNHPPTAEKTSDMEELRVFAKNLAVEIDKLCPDSREKSTALTRLEETVMWAIASIARDGH